MSADGFGPCPDCGSTGVDLYFYDAKLGEAGPFDLSCDFCPNTMHVPAEATARTRIGALRAIVRDHSARRIDGYIVDAVTAGLLVAVYDALSPEKRERFGKPRLDRLVDLAWKVAK